MRRFITTAVIVFCFVAVRAQHVSDQGHFNGNTKTATEKFDTFRDFMRTGAFVFETRSFAMGTVNRGSLTDYATLAAGGGIGYYSPLFKGFHFGVSGFFAFEIFEENIRSADPKTGSGNRYEILLYDMNDLSNTTELDRMEDFYLAYDRAGFSAVFGRQRVNTPMLNEQDNRMRHSSFNGLSLKYAKNGWSVFAGAYTSITMRGTVDWYSVEESFGVYPFGRNPQGTPSEYHDNISCDGIGVLSAAYRGEGVHIQTWNYTAENVFNLSQLQAEGRVKLGQTGILYGLQAYHQVALNDGGNPEPEAAYIDQNSTTLALGGKLGVGDAKQNITINALRINEGGRLLFPREWGREQFFVSLPRERHEGNGDVTAVTLKCERSLVRSGMKVMLGAGSVRNPDIGRFRLNKYGVPSYYHFVGSLDYSFDGYLKGLNVKFIVVNKTAMDTAELADEFRINRVDLWNVSAILNYRF
jgi:hypothetical protein